MAEATSVTRSSEVREMDVCVRVCACCGWCGWAARWTLAEVGVGLPGCRSLHVRPPESSSAANDVMLAPLVARLHAGQAEIMRNVNVVPVDELSDEAIQAARARRSRERCVAAINVC